MNGERILKVIIVGAIFLCGACSGAEHKISAKFYGGEVRVVINRVERARPLALDSVAVYGDVRLISGSPIKSANLECLYLEIDNERSSNIYIDSVAYIMTKDYPADSDGSVTAHAYWLFRHRRVEDLNLSGVKLIVDDSNSDCLTF